MNGTDGPQLLVWATVLHGRCLRISYGANVGRKRGLLVAIRQFLLTGPPQLGIRLRLSSHHIRVLCEQRPRMAVDHDLDAP